MTNSDAISRAWGRRGRHFRHAATNAKRYARADMASAHGAADRSCERVWMWAFCGFGMVPR